MKFMKANQKKICQPYLIIQSVVTKMITATMTVLIILVGIIIPYSSFPLHLLTIRYTYHFCFRTAYRVVCC